MVCSICAYCPASLLTQHIFYRLHALPVVDAKRGHLVGIVSAKDVMRDVMKTASHALPSEESFSKESIPDDLAA